MMEAHLHTWLSLLLRWTHVIAGVAWIGASFYFNWLENRLRSLGRPDDITDDQWAVQGGGIYYLRHLAMAPEELPAQLNWFKRSAYISWITGILMLVVVYYWQAAIYMVDTGIADIPARLAVLSGLATLALSWLFYDVLCRSKLAGNEYLLGGLVFAWFALLTWGLTQLLSGHAAYLHVGAAAGTIMVANVFHMISPAQKEFFIAAREGREPDGAKGAMALQRSRHNSYFALPVLFVMISSHYPAIYGHVLNWLALLLVSLLAVGIRHYFNLLRDPGGRVKLWLPMALVLIVAMYVTVPRPQPQPAAYDSVPPWLQEVRGIIEQRCQQCHSEMPRFEGFNTAPLGIRFESQEQVLEYARVIYEMTVVSQTMPPEENATHMTAEERQTIAAWYALVEHYLSIKERTANPGQAAE